MSTKIQLRRGTATQWTTANPVLAAGEVGYETDTGNIKVGTGTAGSGAWNNLPYYQLPRVSVDPATTSNLNAANYLVQGIYRLATNSNSGFTWTGTPTDFHSATTAESTLTVTIHQYTGQTTLTQQVLTQRTTTTGSVKQWVRLWDGTTLTAWSSTSHLSDNEVTTVTIADATSTTDGVTNSKLRWSAAGSVIGRSAATAGAPADIVAGTDGHVLRRSGTDVGFGTIVSAGIASDAIITAKIADDAVTAAKLADDASTDTNRAVTTNHIRNSAVTTAKIADANVTTAKIVDDAVTAAKLADDASTDANRAVTTNHIRDSAITTGKIADDAVSFAKIQNSAAAGLSVVGRSANSAGAFAEIAAGTDGHVLRRSASTLGFGTIATAGITDGAVTAAKCGTDVLTNVSTRVGCIGFVTANQSDTGGVTSVTSSYPAGVFSASGNRIICSAGTWTGFGLSASGNGTDSGSFTVATTAAAGTSVPAPAYFNGQVPQLLAVLIRVS